MGNWIRTQNINFYMKTISCAFRRVSCKLAMVAEMRDHVDLEMEFLISSLKEAGTASCLGCNLPIFFQ